MQFGVSLFQSVLERLAAENQEDEADSAVVHHRIRGLNSGFVVAAADIAATNQTQLQDAYLSLMPDEEEDLASAVDDSVPQVMPAHLARVSPDEIAADLDLSPQDTAATLAEKRRAFARLNHPDRIDALYSDNATTRMKIANLLIDEAQRRLAGKV
ncbi:MAG: hypothetical protein ACOH2J_13080 [Allorhizobium sp.]